MSNLAKAKNSKKNFARGEEEKDLLMSHLANACLGIVLVSETDAAVEPFVCGEPRSRSLRSYLDVLNVDDKNIEEVTFESFFTRLTTEKEWHHTREKKRIRQFAKLRIVLENELEDLRVIRVGRIRIDIYVAGVAADGRLAGVRTKAIET